VALNSRGRRRMLGRFDRAGRDPFAIRRSAERPYPGETYSPARGRGYRKSTTRRLRMARRNVPGGPILRDGYATRPEREPRGCYPADRFKFRPNQNMMARVCFWGPIRQCGGSSEANSPCDIRTPGHERISTCRKVRWEAGKKMVDETEKRKPRSGATELQLDEASWPIQPTDHE
jgi:hypothetical protein